MPRNPVHAAVPALAILAVMAQPGCIAHIARIQPAEHSLEGAGLIAGSTSVDPAVGQTIRQPLPIDLPFSAWEREAGVLARCEGRVTTPLPWWQRFPVDLVTDFLPMTFEARAERQVTYVPVPARDDDSLFQEASKHGFAHEVSDAR